MSALEAAPPTRHTAGQPGFCCNCGRAARFCLCLACRRAHTDPATGRLAPWLAALWCEAKRLSVREYRQKRAGIVVLPFYDLPPELEPTAPLVVPSGKGDIPRRIHRKGEQAPPRAPEVLDWLARVDGDYLALLRRYSPSGVPLDMQHFLALLNDLAGWPPPGCTVDPGHKEGLVDLYEAVYPA